MQTHCISEQLEFEGFDGHKVVAGFDGGAITSDAGALLLRQVDAVIGLRDRVAACFRDYRKPDYTVQGPPQTAAMTALVLEAGATNRPPERSIWRLALHAVRQAG